MDKITLRNYEAFFVFFLLCLVPLSANAGLKPDEIAIIVARGSRGSEKLAEYYAAQRRIPQENICSVDLPQGEKLSHRKWRQEVRPAIRKWLEENDPQRNLRCLVTTWDVPLRIDRDTEDSATLFEYKEFLNGERTKRIEVLRDLRSDFSLIAPGVGLPDTGDSASDSASNSGAAEESELDKLQKQLDKELQLAQMRISRLSEPTLRQQESAKVRSYAAAIGGAQVLLATLQSRIQAEGEDTPVEVKTEFERIRGMAMAYSEIQRQLEKSAPSIHRDVMFLRVMSQVRGIMFSVRWIDKQLKFVKKNETNSSFDSELSLVLWQDDYQHLRWQPNYLLPEYDNSQLRDSFPTLMVARIDAPTLTLAKGLIDSAIKVEKEGLQGKVYFDSRGIAKLDNTNLQLGSKRDYDRVLLSTAKAMQEQTSLEVVLNDKPELFQPGDCPEAAIYCGWYSLGKYIDAFDWAEGAVGYHLASGEATTLRNKESQVWCKRMIEDGVCATIGPVYEPYLLAFPRPNEFFSLLIQGELSLAECYYRTKPFNSWMMTLVGDPLYRPFANRSVAK